MSPSAPAVIINCMLQTHELAVESTVQHEYSHCGFAYVFQRRCWGLRAAAYSAIVATIWIAILPAVAVAVIVGLRVIGILQNQVGEGTVADVFVVFFSIFSVFFLFKVVQDLLPRKMKFENGKVTFESRGIVENISHASHRVELTPFSEKLTLIALVPNRTSHDERREILAYVPIRDLQLIALVQSSAESHEVGIPQNE